MQVRTMAVDPATDALLDSIPCTARRPRTVEELPGGLTNRNLRVTNPDGCCVVRIPMQEGGGLLGIDREHEYANSVAAAEAGVGAPVLHYRPGTGLTVGYLRGRPLTDGDLQDHEILRLVAAACRRLHCGPRFAGDFDMFDVQARYRRIVAEHGFRLPPRYDEFAALVPRIRAALGQRVTVPCNNDLLAANLLLCPDESGGRQVRIIDFEYSGNNDPAFELGNIWSEAALPPQLLGVLVAAYHGRPSPQQVARARLFALMAKYGWMLWASIQHGSSPLDFDFWSWGMEKYDRAVREFDGPDLEHLLVAARLPD
jgi:thiamine kinase-like enzyme